MTRHLSSDAIRRLAALGGEPETDVRAGGAGPAAPEGTPMAGNWVDGRYRIVRELGRGAMGVVFEAEDDQLGRRVALKCITEAAGMSPTSVRRFVREARAVARLHHPHIAAVYDATEHAIAMQLVDGPTLAEHPRDNPRLLATLMRDAAHAVHHAHLEGLVHRDIKPHNLMVEGRHVYVLDFGLAKLAALDSSLSRSGHVLGTPAYMAPEQASGSIGAVGPAADIYALGATLYHLLSGRPPFVDQDVVRLLRRVVEEDPVPLRRVAGSVDRDLETITMACLRKEPTRRYASAAALAEDLQRWLDGHPILARPSSWSYRANRFVARRKAVVATATILGLTLAVTLAVLLPARQRERAERQAVQRALELSNRVNTVLADVEIYRNAGEGRLVLERLDEGIATIHAFLQRDDVAQANYLLGHLLRARGRPEEASAALSRALDQDSSLRSARFERGLVLLTQRRIALAGHRASLDPSPQLPALIRDLEARARQDLAVIEQATDAFPLTNRLYAQAELARLDGELAAARTGFERVLQLDPRHSNAQTALWNLDIIRGDNPSNFSDASDLARGLHPGVLRAARATREAQDRGETAATGDTPPETEREPRSSTPRRLVALPGLLADPETVVRVVGGGAAVYLERGTQTLLSVDRAIHAGRADEASRSLGTALRDLDVALQFDAGIVAAWNNRAVALMARAHLTRSARPDASLPDATDDERKAARCLDRALALEPAFVPARATRGMLDLSRAATLAATQARVPALLLLESSLADLAAASSASPDEPTIRAAVLAAQSLHAELDRD